jgi:hypothetical protein
MRTIFQNLKRIKHLTRKIKKNSERLKKWCSHFDNEETQYDTEKLIQSVNDMITERGKLRHELHKTNVEIEVLFQGRLISVDELIILVSLTIPAKIETLKLLRRRERSYNQSEDKFKVIMNYDPIERDKKIDALEYTLEEANDVLDNLNITTEITL